MSQLLWRVEGASLAPNLAQWQQGLTLHLLFQPLTLIVARRDGHTRRYLALTGCPQCRPDGCDRVCHRALFEQLVRTTLPGVTLVPTSRLIPRPTETRRLLATPRHVDARPLDAAFLEQWDEGRLVTTWSRLHAKPQPIRVGALLTVGQEGPDPRQVVQARGWSTSRVKTLLYRAAFEHAIPSTAPISSRAGEPLLHALRDPQLLTGSAPTAPVMPEPPALPEGGNVGPQFTQGELVATAPEEA
ncbi:MAG TPA: hypothetical protein PKD53_20335 [Chloroflexaceae bacterium]|nr:hypothetical protein [Chloroflexaceae bacterium]